MGLPPKNPPLPTSPCEGEECRLQPVKPSDLAIRREQVVAGENQRSNLLMKAMLLYNISGASRRARPNEATNQKTKGERSWLQRRKTL